MINDYKTIFPIPKFKKKCLFHRVKELTKSNQTGYGVYHGRVPRV